MTYLEDFVEIGHEVHELMDVGRDLSVGQSEDRELFVSENPCYKTPDCALTWVSWELTNENLQEKADSDLGQTLVCNIACLHVKNSALY